MTGLTPRIEEAISRCFDDPHQVVFAQIGAFDGIAGDPIHELVRQYHWRGVVAEPQKQAFETLKCNYRDEPQLYFANVAISEANESRDLYFVRRHAELDLPDWAPQLASFYREVVLSHHHYIPNIAELIAVEQVDCVTLNRLFDLAKNPPPDLLLIDTEGYDYEIISGIDFSTTKPAILCFEHKHLSAVDRHDCAELLMHHGYRLEFEADDVIASQNR